MAQPPKFDTTDIENEQKALQLLANEVQNTKDDETRDMLIAEIQKSAQKLQDMCQELQARADQFKPPQNDVNMDAVVEVVLTPDQRKRVLDATGIDVPSVRIPDPNATLTKNMGTMKPEFIEKCAMSQAEAFKRLVADAEEV